MFLGIEFELALLPVRLLLFISSVCPTISLSLRMVLQFIAALPSQCSSRITVHFGRLQLLETVSITGGVACYRLYPWSSKFYIYSYM